MAGGLAFEEFAESLRVSTEGLVQLLPGDAGGVGGVGGEFSQQGRLHSLARGLGPVGNPVVFEVHTGS